MAGNDPHESHRAASPLECLFDLTFATSFGLAATQYAHCLEAGQYTAALVGFAYASFAICWAWINFSWFASAYDTDDWVYRLVTMVQMIGVLILAMGLPRLFASIGHAKTVDNDVMVLGYVVMRIAMVSQWLRAAKQDPSRRKSSLTYAATISLAQIGWVGLIFVDTSLTITIVLTSALLLVEFAGPVLAERKGGGTPWHAHHIVERYSLFALIALGEGVVGTVAVLSAEVGTEGWTLDAALVCFAGIGLVFGLWWIYYLLPSAPFLHVHRDRAFVWGLAQMVMITCVVATGAGLQAASASMGGQSSIGEIRTLLCTAVPVCLFLGLIYGLYYYLVRQFDRLHIWLLSITALIAAITLLAAAAGISTPMCLVLLTAAPVVTIVGYEMFGHRHQSRMLATTD